MRVVLDTNVIVSGVLWGGAPRQVMDAARNGTIEVFTSPPLLAELQEVLGRQKFRSAIETLGINVQTLVSGYAALATIVRPPEIQRVIIDDPDDDIVLACAIASSASIIVSGDSHLLKLAKYKTTDIITPAECLRRLG